VGLAARGARNLDAGPERIIDPQELRRVQRQARDVYLKSIALGAALTLIVFLLPT
jgi:hypothetical protein